MQPERADRLTIISLSRSPGVQKIETKVDNCEAYATPRQTTLGSLWLCRDLFALARITCRRWRAHGLDVHYPSAHSLDMHHRRMPG